jgi:hypothetical protein
MPAVFPGRRRGSRSEFSSRLRRGPQFARRRSICLNSVDASTTRLTRITTERDASPTERHSLSEPGTGARSSAAKERALVTHSRDPTPSPLAGSLCAPAVDTCNATAPSLERCSLKTLTQPLPERITETRPRLTRPDATPLEGTQPDRTKRAVRDQSNRNLIGLARSGAGEPPLRTLQLERSGRSPCCCQRAGKHASWGLAGKPERGRNAVQLERNANFGTDATDATPTVLMRTLASVGTAPTAATGRLPESAPLGSGSGGGPNQASEELLSWSGTALTQLSGLHRLAHPHAPHSTTRVLDVFRERGVVKPLHCGYTKTEKRKGRDGTMNGT